MPTYARVILSYRFLYRTVPIRCSLFYSMVFELALNFYT